MRFLIALMIAVIATDASAGLFGRRTSSSGTTSYVANENGQITNTSCSCAMCQRARSAAASGATKFCYGGKCYPIFQPANRVTQAAHRPAVITNTQPPVFPSWNEVRSHTAPVTHHIVKPPQVKPAPIIAKPIVHQAPVVRKPTAKAKPVDPVTAFDPTPSDAAELMVALARVTDDDVVFDLGCGDGRLLKEAADSGAKLCVGIEINPETAAMARKRTAGQNVKIIEGNLFDTDASGADVVFVYLFPGMLNELAPRLQSQLKPGARVVSFCHDIPGVCTRRHIIGDHVFFLWIVEGQGEPTSTFGVASRLISKAGR